MDGVEIASLSGIDNDTRRIEYIALGARDVDSGTRGTLYFDAFESRRETYIGLAAGVESSLGAWAPAPRQATLKVKAAMINNIDGEPDVVQRPVKAEPAQSKTQPAAWLLELWEPTGNEGLKNEGLNFVPQAVEMSMVAGDPCAIDYEYDPLGRLTGVRYSDGRYFRYTYDAAGNQLASESRAGKTVYSYDAANRLASVDGVTQTWDANGNLLSDGANVYTFDHANRLKAVTGLEDSVTYRYNALGDRLETTVNGITTTHYTLDLAAGLTQVLDDGTHTYLYGNGRIAQHGPSGGEYFLGDALGSVRQLVDGAGTVVLAQNYTPYGETLSRSGTGKTAFAFTGEAVDAYTGLVYLRARWYAPQSGRFIARDTWQGNAYKPMSLNAWNYVEANPINFVDPTGHIAEKEALEADKIVQHLSGTYNVLILKDWGGQYSFNPNTRIVNKCGWTEGLWNIQDLRIIEHALNDVTNTLGNISKFKSAFGRISVRKIENEIGPIKKIRPFAPPGLLSSFLGDFVMPQGAFADEAYAKFSIAHELGHVWDYRNENSLSEGLILALETRICDASGNNCGWLPYTAHVDEPTLAVIYPEPSVDTYRNCPPGFPNPSNPDKDCRKTPYSNTYGISPLVTGPGAEDWANSFAAYVYPNYYSTTLYVGLIKGGIRESYVQKQNNSLP